LDLKNIFFVILGVNHLKKVLGDLLSVIKAGEVVSLLWTMAETLD